MGGYAVPCCARRSCADTDAHHQMSLYHYAILLCVTLLYRSAVWSETMVAHMRRAHPHIKAQAPEGKVGHTFCHAYLFYKKY